MPIELPIIAEGNGLAPRIASLLIKPASAICNLDCTYCFYLDRESDPYTALPARRMTEETLERLVETYLFYSYPNSTFAFQGGEPTLAGPAFFEKLVKLQQECGRNGQAVANAIKPMESALAIHHHAGTIWALSVRDLRPMVAGTAEGADTLFSIT
jgi:uncharacterized protein